MRNRPASEAIAKVGWIFLVVGLLGVLLVPNLLLLWVFLIFFGLAGLPRAVIEWRRERERR
jgi:hypothetical protein